MFGDESWSFGVMKRKAEDEHGQADDGKDYGSVESNGFWVQAKEDCLKKGV